MKIHRTKKCDVEWCEMSTRAYGYCEKHYQRYKKYGDPNISNRGYQNFIKYISANEYVRISREEMSKTFSYQ